MDASGLSRASKGGALTPSLAEQLHMQRSLSQSSDASREKVCPVCSQPSKPKKKYCDKHNRAFDNIMRQACKPPNGTKVVKKPKAKKSKRNGKDQQSQSNGSSDDEPKTDEHKAFLSLIPFFWLFRHISDNILVMGGTWFGLWPKVHE